MYKFVFFLFFSFQLFSASADEKVIVCRDINQNGYPVQAAKYFILSPNDATLKVYVKADGGIGTYSAVMKIYNFHDGKEHYDSQYTIDTKPDWDYFWKDITFNASSTYRFDVYDGNNKLVGSELVFITIK